MGIVTEIIFLLIIFAGCLFGCAITQRKFEDFLSITLTGIVAILFVFGFCGALYQGVFVVVSLSIVLYLLSIMRIKKNKSFSDVKNRMLTPVFGVFILFVVFFTYTLYGKLFFQNDEFSHWGDVVIAMVQNNLFSTAPEMDSLFKTYPPGTALLQYFIEVVNGWIFKGAFTEYLCHFAFCVFIMSFILPAFKNLKWNVIDMLVVCCIIFFIPQTFYYSTYSLLFIDPFVGMLFGGGLLALALCNEKDKIYDLYMYSILFMLVLAKDAGMFFAIFLLVAYIFDRLLNGKCELKKFSLWVRAVLCPVVAVVAPKLMWNYCIKRDNAAKSFPSKYDINNFIEVLKGNDTSSKRTVFENFVQGFIGTDIMDLQRGIKISYLAITIIVLTSVTVLMIQMIKKGLVVKVSGVVTLVTCYISIPVYTVGLCMTYMYNFSEFEAVRLMSFDRYIDMVYLGVWLLLFIGLFEFVQGNNKNKIWAYIIIVGIAAYTIPIKYNIDHLTRNLVKESQNVRGQFIELREKVFRNMTSDDRLYFICQEKSGYPYFIMRTELRPYKVANRGGWSIGPAFYEDDIYSVNKTSEEFGSELQANYDYVGILELNDYFIDNYSVLFEDADAIAENCLYKVNKETGKLMLVE